MDLLKIASLLEQIAQEIRNTSPEAASAPAQPAKVKLADLQVAGRTLLEKDRRDLLTGVLTKFGLPNLSSAKEADFPTILKALNAALGTASIIS